MREASVVGVDLGGTKVTAGLVRDGSVVRAASRQVSAESAEQVVVDEVLATIVEVFDDTVAGIGCGVPSVVDVDTGVVFEVENIPSWSRVPLKDLLERTFGVPAHVNNDANAFAVGELIFGKGRPYRNIVGLTLGTGLGAGIIINGRLYCGRHCGAGEIGMMPYRGETLETFCSGRYFLRETGEKGEVVYERARSGDADARAVFDAFGRELAAAVVIAVYAYDPDAVIFGGSVARASGIFRKGLDEALASSSYQPLTRDLVIEVSDLDNAAVLGAAALFIDAANQVGPRIGGRPANEPVQKSHTRKRYET